MTTVYVVTNPENGWDCVQGVYATYELAEEACKPEDYEGNEEFWKPYLTRDGLIEGLVIHTKRLES